MNYTEEQTTELDSLGYIFPDELTVMDQGPPATFQITCKLDNEELLGLLKMHALAQGLTVHEDYQETLDESDEDEYATHPHMVPTDTSHGGKDDEQSEGVDDTVFHHPTFAIEFTYTPTYPEELPLFKLVQVKGICAEDRQILYDKLLAHGSESLGMGMIFAMVSHGKEQIEQLLTSRMLREEHDREQRILAEEEADRERYRGTLVTPDSFSAWRTKFLEEARQLKKAGAKLSISHAAALAIDLNASNKASGKLTGRQMFERDQTLVSSDVQFMEEGDVVVDVELFDGLEIDNDSADGGDNEVLAGFTEDD
ncbi:hypothetical protein BATDEDRAFT_85611 [Batrachochytrium dendrobatidis JAM81]|uniref:RWD domain-containing protein n=1 Tax=Batrachochytrium dendrobatidis (strain JAM81 / FGSC 10211) TaxID=684364 RepID=F4NRZ5_BATDJ|nr:uncharacterized protein BATDEDRAFT_85611 [Batrachochytrium dendrobatidis JAM81]EGF83786.1 hypothetical protein BATDEDRAFT_85611 [Batrachochytrium dendrobatidis JAM81]|eukprot:XP_006676225.1 hypothetical protein BATDEDRAFT_85611 [Batrachochytrium dendrobatidis JAM81]